MPHTNKSQIGCIIIKEEKQVKYGNKTPDGGGEQNTLVNVEDASCSIMTGIPTKEWDDLPSPGIMLCQNSS